MDTTVLYIAIIVLLQVCSAVFSGSETAMTAASRAHLHQLAQQGNRRAQLAQRVLEKKDQLLGTLLVGNNFVNTAAAAVATSLLTRLFGGDAGMGAVAATLIITLTLLIFSEVLPKTFALRHAVAVTQAVAPLMWVLMRLLAPLTWGVIALVRGVLFLFGAESKGVGMSYADELRGAIDLHQGPEEEVRQERAMLRSVLDLNEMDVRAAMTHRRQVETIHAELSPQMVIEEALASSHTRLPLWKGDPENIVGVIHAKALFRELQRVHCKVEDVEISKVMTPPWFIPESTTLLEQMEAFRERREHFAIVVDEYGVFLGIITLEDILEEIVGEIEDEHDIELSGVVKQANGSYLVDGDVSIRELNRLYEWRLPDDGASTIGGLVLYEVRRVPEIGQTFEFHGFRFEVLRRQRNQVTQLRLWPPRKDAGHAA